jgi:hypothetical protein
MFESNQDGANNCTDRGFGSGSLQTLVRAGNTAQKVARRARILLLAAEGLGDSEISRRVQANRKTVVEWRRRAPQIAEGSVGNWPTGGARAKSAC